VFPWPPQTNPNIFYRPQIYRQGVQFTHYEPGTPIGTMSECQVSQFPLKLVLKIFHLRRKKRCSAQKKPWELFTRDEDILLIQIWLNISKDPIVENDQKAERFWSRIATNYNQYRGSCERKSLVN